MDSQLYIYNTLSRKKELFEPLNPPFVGLYVCGPTVYKELHLGNLRTYVSFDVLHRYLKYLGYQVRYVRNITDVGHLESDADEGEDKIARQAKLEQVEPMELVTIHTRYFHRVLKMFNLIPPHIEPTATGHIPEQIKMIEKIIENGYAYVTNGSVYFDVHRFMDDHHYGILSGRKIEDLIEGSRDLDSQKEKKNSYDFALWKKATPQHIMKWDSPWSWGYPGWHLECSVMSTKYLGSSFDIHGGGMDLVFPHHECEIAQNVGAEGHPPVKYWMHGNMLTVNGQKMSKSLGNSFLPDELVHGDHPLLEKGYSSMTARFFMLQSHYRSTLDFSNDALSAAEKGFKRLMNANSLLKGMNPDSFSDSGGSEDEEIAKIIERCHEHMNDDLNTAQTIARLFDLSGKINLINDKKIQVSAETTRNMQSVFHSFLEEILGLREEESGDHQLVDGLMDLVIHLRNEARSNKDWGTSDAIRDQLNELNILLKDGKDGTNWVVQ